MAKYKAVVAADLKIVKIDNEFFLGMKEDSQVTKAMPINMSSIDENITDATLASYIKADLTGDLINVDFGTIATPASRELKTPEVAKLGYLNAILAEAAKTATAYYVGLHFDRLLGK